MLSPGPQELQSSVVCRSIPENKARDSIKPLHSAAPRLRVLCAVKAYTQSKHLLFLHHLTARRDLEGGGCLGPRQRQHTAQRASSWGRPAPLGQLGGGLRVQGAEAASGALALSDWFSCPRDSKARPRPSSASEPGSARSGTEWALARRWGRAGARGPGLEAGWRPLPNMRKKAAGGAERRPLQPRTEAAAAAPAGRGTWRSPLLGVAGPAGRGRRRRSVPAPAWLGPAAPPQPPTGSAQGTAPPNAPGGGAGWASWPRAERTGSVRCGPRKCGRGGDGGVNDRDVRSRRGVPFPSVFRSDLRFNSLLEASELISPGQDWGSLGD